MDDRDGRRTRRLVGVYDTAMDPSEFWTAWKQWGGERIFDDDGNEIDPSDF